MGRLILEAATMAFWGLATASVLASRWDDEPGKVASGALLAIYAAGWMVPERWKPWAGPTDPRWATAFPWWWVALGVGVLVTVAFSWDSRQSGPLRPLLRRRGSQSAQGADARDTREPGEVDVAHR